jgi:hypothetical protein
MTTVLQRATHRIIAGSGLLLMGIAGLALPTASSVARADAGGTTVIEVMAPKDASTAAPLMVTNHRCHILPVVPAPGQVVPTTTRPDCDIPVPGVARVSGSGSPPCFQGCGVMNYNGGSVITSTAHQFYFLNCIGGGANCFTNSGDPYTFLRDYFSSNFIHVVDQYMQPTVLKTSGRYTTSSQALMSMQSVGHTIQDSDVQAIITDLIRMQFPNGGGG